jgi:hypothetical protein
LRFLLGENPYHTTTSESFEPVPISPHLLYSDHRSRDNGQPHEGDHDHPGDIRRLGHSFVGGETLPRGADKAAMSRAGRTGWVNTADRDARLAVPHNASPSGRRWHAIQLGFDPDNLTPEQAEQVEEHRRVFYAELSRKGRAGRDRRYAARLRALADQAEKRNEPGET